MSRIQQISSIIFLGFLVFSSAIYLVHHTYIFRVAFSEIEKLNQEEEDLSFKYNLLLSKVEYYRNQLTIRKVAKDRLKMISPSNSDQIIIYLERHKK